MEDLSVLKMSKRASGKMNDEKGIGLYEQYPKTYQNNNKGHFWYSLMLFFLLH